MKKIARSLEPAETKNDEARTVPLMGELYGMLVLQKQLRDQCWPRVLFRCGKRITDLRGTWAEASKRAEAVEQPRAPVS
jgi:hypothetical protein